MKLKILRFLIPTLAACLFLPQARAVQMTGLFEAEIPVIGQGSEERDAAIRAAFKEVLIKVTGYSAVLLEPALSGVVDKAKDYIRQYRYTAPTPQPDGSPGQQKLWVQFGEKSIYRLLKDARLPIWGEARPKVLVWLVMEERGKRRLIGASEPGKEVDAMLTQARARGVPLVFPLLDLKDRARVTAADVWGGFHEAVMEASARYQSQGVLFGRVYPAGGQWRGDWTLNLGTEPVVWEAAGVRSEQVLQSGVDGTAESLSMRYAHAHDEVGQVVLDLQVQAIGSLAAYERVSNYLGSLSGVAGVQLNDVQNGQASWRLLCEVGARSVIQNISLGSVLQRVESPPTVRAQAVGAPAVEGLSPELVYRYLP